MPSPTEGLPSGIGSVAGPTASIPGPEAGGVPLSGAAFPGAEVGLPPEAAHIESPPVEPLPAPEVSVVADLEGTLEDPHAGIERVAGLQPPGGEPEVGEVTPDAVEGENAVPENQGTSTAPEPEKGAESAAQEHGDEKPQEETPTEGDQPSEQPTQDGQTTEGQKAESEQQTQGDQQAEKASDKNEASGKDPSQRREELEKRIKDRTATADEIKEYRELKQDPEKRRDDLEQKALDGTITDQEADELAELYASGAKEALSPEEQMEKLQKEIDDVGMELMKKLANGEEVTEADLERLRSLRTQESLMNQGLTAEQAKPLSGIAEKMRQRYAERQTKMAKDIQEKIQELMALELYLQTIPKTVEQLREEAKKLQKEANAAHKEAEDAKGSDRLQKKQKEYSLYMQLLNAKSRIVAQKHMAGRIDARRVDLEQEVRRKLDVSSGLMAILEFGRAKTTHIRTEIGIGIEEEVDFWASS